MADEISFYGMLVFLTLTLSAGYIAAILFLGFKPRKSTESQLARRALRSLDLPDKPTWKTVIISASRDVEVPVEKLWETWCCLESWPQWSALHASARWAGDPAWQVGARFEQALHLGFPFGRVTSVETVGQFFPGREVAWSRTSGATRSCHVWSFTLLPNRGVRVTNIEVFHGTLIGLLKPMILFQWQKAFEKSLIGLVRHANQA